MKALLARNWKGIGAALLLAFIVCVLLPGYFIAASPDDFGHLEAAWLRKVAAALFALAATVLLVFYAALTRFGGQHAAKVALWMGFAWVCTVGFAIPIAKSVEMVAPIMTPIAWVPLAIAIALTLLVGWLAASGKALIALVYLAVQMAFAVIPAFPGIWSAYFPGARGEVERFTQLSGERNVLVVSFDDLSGHLSREVLRDDPALRGEFADFILFEEVVGNAPGTEISIAHELYGARDFAGMASDTEQLKQALPGETLALNDPGVDAMAYASYALFAEDDARKIEVGDLSGGLDPVTAVQGIEDLYDYVWLRLGTRYALSVLDKLGRYRADPIEHVFDLVQSDCSQCDTLSLRLADHKGAVWDRHSLNSLRDFRAFTRDIERGDSDFAIRYLHFLFTHFPVDLDAGCAYRADDAEWVEANQTEAGARAETGCALRSASLLIDRLKEEGIYDNTVIVFKSDHGKKATYFDSAPHNLGFSGNAEWGYDRYRPLLMIKPAGRRSDALATTDRPAAISDLAATLCPMIEPERDCAAYQGVDLLEPAGAEEPDIPVYVPSSPDSTHRFRDLEPVAVERGSDLRRLATP